MSKKWDIRFLELAEYIAQSWSKDKSTKVGCVIVGPDREVRSMGYNGFPRGVDDTVDERYERPAKYKWTEHAERNAVYNAARMGVSLKGCNAYIPWYPCSDCARAVIQSGIEAIIAYTPDFDDPRWGPDFRVSNQMLDEAGVIQVLYDRQPKREENASAPQPNLQV